MGKMAKFSEMGQSDALDIGVLSVWPDVSACVLKGREEEIVVVGRFEGELHLCLRFLHCFLPGLYL